MKGFFQAERSGSLPWLERVRVEGYLPDLPSSDTKPITSFEEESPMRLVGGFVWHECGLSNRLLLVHKSDSHNTYRSWSHFSSKRMRPSKSPTLSSTGRSAPPYTLEWRLFDQCLTSWRAVLPIKFMLIF